MRLIAERGGFVGVATYTPFLPWQDESTVDQCVEVFEHVINVAGEDHVGVGTDFTEGQDVAFFDWLRRDKGIGRVLVPGEVRVPPGPKGLETLADYHPPHRRDAAARVEPPARREGHGRELAPPLREVWTEVPEKEVPEKEKEDFRKEIALLKADLLRGGYPPGKRGAQTRAACHGFWGYGIPIPVLADFLRREWAFPAIQDGVVARRIEGVRTGHEARTLEKFLAEIS